MAIQCKYVCSECGKEFEITPDLMVCPFCSKEQKDNEPLRGILEVKYTSQGKFHVEDLIPVEQSWFPDIPVGSSPIWRAEHLDDRKHLYFEKMIRQT